MKQQEKRKGLLCLLLTLCLLLSGCGGQGGAQKDPLEDVPEELRRNVIPWHDNAVEQAKSDGKLHFYFMSDMGYAQPNKWGDSCLIIAPDGTTVLIDSGVADFGPLLVQNLKLLGVEKLDYLILSHLHVDHTGGANVTGGVLDNFEVGQAYFNGAYGTWNGNKVLIEKLKKLEIPCEVLSEGKKLTLGESVQVEVLWPETAMVGGAYGSDAEVNNTSTVMRLEFGETSALFTGDIYVEIEEKLADKYADKLDVDLVKAPHHGARTSNSAVFAQATTPSVVVATGYQAMPTDVYSNYTSTGSRVYLDIMDGFVHVTSDGKTLQVETSRERTSKYYEDYEYKG